MRWGIGLVALLIAVAVVLTLSTHGARRSFEAIPAVAPALRENVTPQPFDEQAARDMLARLAQLVDDPEPGEDELATAATTCAAWASGSKAGSREYHVAVKLRGAADALRSVTPPSDDPNRRNARRLLAEARQALESSTLPGPGPLGALRDQIENLQDAQRERVQEVEKEVR